MKLPPYSKEEIERQYEMAPLMLMRAVQTKRPAAVEFAMKSIERILEAKLAYEEAENESVSR